MGIAIGILIPIVGPIQDPAIHTEPYRTHVKGHCYIDAISWGHLTFPKPPSPITLEALKLPVASMRSVRRKRRQALTPSSEADQEVVNGEATLIWVRMLCMYFHLTGGHHTCMHDAWRDVLTVSMHRTAPEAGLLRVEFPDAASGCS